MQATFACPECGERIRLPRHAPGRQVRCEECATLVEVPFFPRPTGRRRRAAGPGWSWVAIVLGLAVIVATGTYLVVKSRIRVGRERGLRLLVAAADDDVRQGLWGPALGRLSDALAQAERFDLADADRREGLRVRIADLTERLAEERRDRTLAAAEADLTTAEALATGSPPDAARALELAEQAYAAADRLPDARALALAARAVALATGLVAARGAIVEPIAGKMLQGPTAAEAHGRRLAEPIAAFLRLRGYLPRTAGSPLVALWDGHAPYRLASELLESEGEGYLQSAQRTTRIEARFRLDRAGRPEPLWQTRFTAKTRVPVPRMPALQSGYIGIATKRDADIERRLYDDAVAVLSEQLAQKFGNLPVWSP